MPREFEMKHAVREAVPLIFSLVGPSSSGKTFSALRLATGMREVVGGHIGYIDTEAKRALHYADAFDFEHLALDAPFGPLDYLEAIKYVKERGATICVVDSLSHEHEGPGGVLEQHEAALDRMAGNDFGKRKRMNFAAWAEPKAARRRLVNSVLQLGINVVLCFRAKEKLKLERGKDPQELGWQPIAGVEWMYESTVQALLYPNSGGVPTWHPQRVGEQQVVKLPAQFKDFLCDGRALNERHGHALAEWARGGAAPIPDTPTPEPPTAAKLISRAQQTRLFAMVGEAAKRLELPPQAVEDWLRQQYKTIGIDSTKQLTDPPYGELCDSLEHLTAGDLTEE